MRSDVVIQGGTEDEFWPVRVQVKKDGDPIPYDLWFWYRWQAWPFRAPIAGEPENPYAQADGAP